MEFLIGVHDGLGDLRHLLEVEAAASFGSLGGEEVLDQVGLDHGGQERQHERQREDPEEDAERSGHDVAQAEAGVGPHATVEAVGADAAVEAVVAARRVLSRLRRTEELIFCLLQLRISLRQPRL